MKPQGQSANLCISRGQRLLLNLSCLFLACKAHKWQVCQNQIEGIARVLTGH